jgi:signal transduction histidine kinase
VRDRFAAIDPRALIEEVADLYAPVVEEAGRPFALAVDGTPPVRPLHRELMSQAIANLIDNALKHAREGAIVLRLAASAEELAFAVEDRGPGIAPEDRDAVRRRFARLDAARSVPGAGLGMALVEAVARLHDGRLELDDNAPGLIARIVLPR